MTAAALPDRGVAVAIACYNQAAFLGEAITSVLDQSQPASEIILVDDGSTDGTPAVAARFPQLRYHHQKNAGLSAARNTGLRLANAHRILFLDADDRLTRGCLEQACDRLDREPALAFVYGGYAEVDAQGRHLASHAPREFADGFLGLLSGNHIAMHGTVLYDTRRLRDAGGFDEQLPSCEDYDVYLRLARVHPIAAYTAIAAEYRRHGGAMSRNRLRMIDTARCVIHRSVHQAGDTLAHRRAAQIGVSAMTDYYAEQIWTDLTAARWERRLIRTSAALLREASRHPAAFGHFLRRLVAGSLRPPQ